MSRKSSLPVRAVLLDLDGVLWKEEQPLLDIPELFQLIQASGRQVFCLTNNSTRSRSAYQSKLSDFGVSLSRDQILTSAAGAASYLLEKFPAGGEVFIVGEEGLEVELMDAGFQIISGEKETHPAAVAVGLDRRLNYQKIHQAAKYIQRGAIFLGTNPDPAVPTPEGLAPGAGAVIAAVETAVGRPPIIIGKPEPYLFRLAVDRTGLKPESLLMIGDRLETDILGGQNAGIQTGLVLSGVTSAEQAASWQPQPDYSARNALELLQGLENYAD